MSAWTIYSRRVSFERAARLCASYVEIRTLWGWPQSSSPGQRCQIVAICRAFAPNKCSHCGTWHKTRVLPAYTYTTPHVCIRYIRAYARIRPQRIRHDARIRGTSRGSPHACIRGPGEPISRVRGAEWTFLVNGLETCPNNGFSRNLRLFP